MFLAPVIRGIKGTHEQVIDDLKKQGFTKIRIDLKIYPSAYREEEAKLAKYEKHWIEAVIDSVKIDEEERSQDRGGGRAGAPQVGKGRMIVIGNRGHKAKKKEIDRFADETCTAPSARARTTPRWYSRASSPGCSRSTPRSAHARCATVLAR